MVRPADWPTVSASSGPVASNEKVRTRSRHPSLSRSRTVTRETDALATPSTRSGVSNRRLSERWSSGQTRRSHGWRRCRSLRCRRPCIARGLERHRGIQPNHSVGLDPENVDCAGIVVGPACPNEGGVIRQRHRATETIVGAAARGNNGGSLAPSVVGVVKHMHHTAALTVGVVIERRPDEGGITVYRGQQSESVATCTVVSNEDRLLGGRIRLRDWMGRHRASGPRLSQISRREEAARPNVQSNYICSSAHCVRIMHTVSFEMITIRVSFPTLAGTL